MTGRDETPIRPEILKAYYTHMYGRQSPGKEAFEGATFEEYHKLLRNTFWTISREKAALRSKNPVFNALAEKFATEPGGSQAPAEPVAEPKERKKSAVFEKLDHLDLAAADLPSDLHSLFLDQIKMVSGLNRLRELKELRVIEPLLCDTDERMPAGAFLKLTRLDINKCTDRFLKSLMGMSRSEWVRIKHQDSPALDLGLVKEYRELRSLYVDCDLTIGTRHLSGLPLEILWLTNVEMNRDFREALTSLGNTLIELNLKNAMPFGPDSLPELSRLEKLTVPAYPEFESQWISFAVSHPRTMCVFPAVEPPDGKRAKARIAEIYRGVPILEMRKGEKIWFEAWGDLAARYTEENISNNELKDRLDKVANKCKPKVKLSSEGDELRLHSASQESLRVCIDALP